MRSDFRSIYLARNIRPLSIGIWHSSTPHVVVRSGGYTLRGPWAYCTVAPPRPFPRSLLPVAKLSSTATKKPPAPTLRLRLCGLYRRFGRGFQGTGSPIAVEGCADSGRAVKGHARRCPAPPALASTGWVLVQLRVVQILRNRVPRLVLLLVLLPWGRRIAAEARSPSTRRSRARRHRCGALGELAVPLHGRRQLADVLHYGLEVPRQLPRVSAQRVHL